MNDIRQVIRTRLKWVQLYQTTNDAGLGCRRCGISRPTLRKWWQRFQVDREDGLQEHSRAPHKTPTPKVTAHYEKLILKFRRERNLGAKRIQAELLRHRNWRVSTSTIWKVLARHLAPPLRRHRTPQARIRYNRPVPGERIQIDTTKIVRHLSIYCH